MSNQTFSAPDSAHNEANVIALFAEPAPEARSAIPHLQASGLSILQIIKLAIQYGVPFWDAVTKLMSGTSVYVEWFKQVIDAVKNGKPLPPLPA